MPILRIETPLPFPAAAVRAWHTRPGAFERLQPSWGPAEVVERTGTVEEGARLVMKVPPFGQTWVALHHDHPDGFVDEQVSGPMRRWRHTHHFLPDGEGCRIVDEIDYDFFGPDVIVERQMRPLFAWRAERLRAELARLPARPLRIAVAGASGLVGGQLVPFLTALGHTVHRLVRRAPGPGEIQWDPTKGKVDLPEVDAVVNLCGESIADGRWSDARKQALLDSRLGPTFTLSGALRDLPGVVLVNASAIGFYGDRGDEELTEDSAQGAGFVAELCRRWEAEAEAARVVKLRIGVVMSKLGGALPKMLGPAMFGANGPLGTGRQWQSWIGLDDLLYTIHRAIVDPSLAGPVNATAPRPERQIDVARALGRVVHRPAWAPVPAFALRVAFGEMADEVILASAKVLPTRLGADGFFKPEIDGLLRWELVSPAP